MGDIADQLEEQFFDIPDYDWVTSDGTLLFLDEIEDSHLLNIIKFLKRKQPSPENSYQITKFENEAKQRNLPLE